MERAIPILPADDLTLAKEFYVNRLGFDVRFEATEDGRSGLLGIDRGTISITLDSPMSGHGREACVSLQVKTPMRTTMNGETRLTFDTRPKTRPGERERLT